MMMSLRQALEFERPIVELEQRIAELKEHSGGQLAGEIAKLEQRSRALLDEIFANLTPWQNVQLSRHPLRPLTLDYVERLCQDFFELHGDRAFRDDPAVIGGPARLVPGQRR